LPLKQWNGHLFKSYAWCCDCERAWPTHEWEREQGYHFCPGVDCKGGRLSARPWELLRLFDPSYPEVPVREAEYQGPDKFYPAS
jgi:hypothetical protein